MAEVFVIGAMYAGLFIFALNGLQWMALRNKQFEIKAESERARRLLMRSTLRGRR